MQPASQIHWRAAPGVSLSSGVRTKFPSASRPTSAAPFMGMVLEAVKGMRRDVMLRQSPWEKVARGATLSAVILRELAGLILAAPYGWHAHSVYWGLDRASGDADGGGEQRKHEEDAKHWNLLLALAALVRTAVAWGRAVIAMAGLSATPAISPSHQSKKQRGTSGSRETRPLAWGTTPLVPGVKLMTDIRYGYGERQVLDVYVPECARSSSASAPVLLFVHGGVWASGEKWHYAPLAATCSQAGVLVVVIQYTLYPQVLSCEQAAEVSSALTWTFDNISSFGGDPSRIFLAGHSSGAHICALALWERGCVGLCNALRACATTDAMSREEEQGHGEDTRQPFCFLGLSGVYDIAQHLIHETKRGVDVISCMTPANGGSPSEFAARSPATLAAALAAAIRPPPHGATFAPDLTRGTSVGDSFDRAQRLEDSGELLQSSSGQTANKRGRNAGLPRPVSDRAGSMPPASSEAFLPRSFPSADGLAGSSGGAASDAEWQDMIGQRLLRRISESCSLGGADLAGAVAEVLQSRAVFPPCVLYCSPGDIVVPPDTSLAFARELRALGHKARVITYDDVGHSAFACWSLDWGEGDRPPLVRDVLGLLIGSDALDE